MLSAEAQKEVPVLTRRQSLQQTLAAAASLAMLGPRPLTAAPDSIDASASLRAHAQRRGLRVGCAVAASDLRDPRFCQLLAAQASIVVAENAMKFGALQAKPGTWEFADGDALVAFAHAHKIAVRGHNFVWHENLPAWFASTVTRENARQVLTTHIRTVAGHYKGKISCWDVVNEAIRIEDGRPDGLRKSPWFELIGPEYLELAYRTAHEADPHAKLTYNEYGIEDESEAETKKRAATLDLLKRLKAAGAPIHALGIQSHLPAAGATYGPGLRQLIAAAQALGLEVYLTEMDVNDDAVDSDDTAERDRRIAQVYTDYLNVALENRAVKSILTWGLTDRNTWLNHIESHRKKRPNRSQRPLPFDENYAPVPAFFALRDAIDKAPKR
jgi:endo-1,4-beta-xylanase